MLPNPEKKGTRGLEIITIKGITQCSFIATLKQEDASIGADDDGDGGYDDDVLF